MDVADNKFREQMGKRTSAMETVGHLISQSLTLMTAMMNPSQVTNANQHQNVRNNNVEQEEIDGFLERAFRTQN